MNFYEQIFSRGRATGEGMTHFERLFAAKFGGSPPPEVREYTGAVPVTITADGTPLLDLLISGNEEHSGTPSPTSPVMPQGCGNKTANLWTLYPNQTYRGVTFEFTNNTIKMNNTCTQEGNIGDTINLKAGTYTIAANANINISQNTHILQIYKANVVSETISLSDMISGKATFTIAEDTTDILIRIHIMNDVDYSGLEIQPMLNAGSTAIPFEPDGYKIPILSGDTTTNIYLGEVETTRKIQKLVLTGEEDWSQSGAVSNTFYTVVSGYLRQRGVIIDICSHYTSQANINGAAEMQDGNVSFYANAGQQFEYFYVRDNNLATVANLKSYLQQQYAAGTPVCVWYVLATPQTAVVNEPLMRIGDYADTLSKTQAGVTIPTNNGSTTVDVDTTVKPSEVYIKYMG